MVAVFGKAGVVHRPRRRLKLSHQPLGQAAPDRPPVPRGGRHEVVQRLVVHLTAKPSDHRLDRLASPVQHQPAQVALAAGALILARQRREDVVREPFQASADGGQLGRCDASQQLPSA